MSRRSVFGSLLGLVFLMNMARVVFAPLIEPIRVTTGASDATLGLLATLVWLGSGLTRLPTGFLLTRISRAKVIFGSGVVLTLGTTFTALTDDPELLLEMADTRARKRALSIATGVGAVAVAELKNEVDR